MSADERERITILSAKDLDISYFCGSGNGGQAKNKVASGVLITHRETGAQGRASDSRSQAQNKKAAFERLLKTPQMKFWLAKKLYEIRQQETLEQTIEKELEEKNLKIEVKNLEGKWVQVDSSYFDTQEARKET